MAAKTTRAKAKPASTKTPAPPRRSLLARGFLSFWRPLPLLVAAIGLAGMVFWPQIKVQLPNLSQRDEYQVRWADVVISPRPRWVPEAFLSQVRQRSEMEESFSLLEDSLVQELSQAFARHPWVAEVQSVSKQTGTIQVQLDYRHPALMVQTRRGTYPVDGEGILLPPTDFSAADAEMFPRLEGVRSTPQGRAGTPWGDTVVVDGARLATELSQSSDGESAWDQLGLESIVVLARRGDVAAQEAELFGLTTSTGSRIIWGHAPGADALEPSVEQKLQRLQQFLASNGSFEDMPEPVLIDVHDWEQIRWDVLSRMPPNSAARR